jgi:hypothetical protein
MMRRKKNGSAIIRPTKRRDIADPA